MDIVTHGLASIAVARAFFPRSPKQSMVFAVLAGTLADLDWLSIYAGPSAFLSWHRAYLHSVLVPILIVSIIPAIVLASFLFHKSLFIAVCLPKGQELPTDPHALAGLVRRSFFGAIIGAPLSAGLLHIAMDACQSDGVALFRPFSAKRFALDWLPGIDPWILVILIAALALPELLHLVSSEIGAKAKKPRGQTGAIIGLALLVVYVGARAVLHSDVVAMMQARTFRGEPVRKTAAFPETLSLLTWHGIVETESALNETTVDLASGNSFDPDTSLRFFKPESSPELEAAQRTAAVARFLSVARFPKASVEKTETGYLILLRDLYFAAAGETQHELAVGIQLDAAAKVTSAEIVWARDLHR